MKRLLFLLWASTTVFLPTLRGQDPAKFDTNKDGILDASERRAFFIHRNNATYREFDTNFDGHLSAAELKKLEKKEDDSASLDEVSWQTNHPSDEPTTTSPELVRMFPDKTKVPVDDLKLWGFQIRRSLADVKPGEKQFDPKTPPAAFSYQRDFAHDADVWSAKGVVARPFLFSDAGSSSLIPSIEFDRFSNSGDPTKARDLLVFRIGSEIGLPGIPDGNTIAGNRLRINTAFKTDSGLGEETWAGEVEWETSYGPLGNFHPMGDLPIAWFPRAYIRAEFGTRSDHRELLTADQKDFCRIGPVLGLQLTPYFQKGWDDRLVATLSYAYLASAKGDHDVRNFVARLDWTLDAKGHLKLGAEYQNGALTLEQRGTETFTVGLGVAF